MIAGECRREYIGTMWVRAPWKTLVNLLSPARKGLRRMQEELHDTVGPGSTPGCGFKTAVV